MSGHLWRYYFEDDVDSFRHVLQNAAHTPARPGTQKGLSAWQAGGLGLALNSSPGSYGGSPVLNAKGRRHVGQGVTTLTRSDINSRDGMGMSILHHAASSNSQNALGFAQALIEHPLTDLYIQDAENGWTSLHRAFYFGNIAIARLILNRDTQNILGQGSSGFNPRAPGLVKIKDKEGFGPLDLYAMTIKDRTLLQNDRTVQHTEDDDEFAQGDSGDRDDQARRKIIAPPVLLNGDDVFTFGSNKNVTLGFGDQDDRQFPERIVLRRPDHLLRRFYQEDQEERSLIMASMHMPSHSSTILQPTSMDDLPVQIRNRPIIVQDVKMSKLHSAIITTDPVSNLFMCGHGPGGRLGTGDETTRYQFTPVEGGGLGKKKVISISLGQNHSLAITEEGEVFSWGNNRFGQLGYMLPAPNLKDDDPISALPRQIFGPFKRELITGVAASRIHSVAHTSTSLYTFGKNEGQLGIVASDARSLETQVIPRKIAASLFSAPILSASAIDGATICLLENREVWVFANYGYARLNFPLDGFTNQFLKESWLTTKYDSTPNQICKITSGGDTICALSSSGEIFTVTLSRRPEISSDTQTSTTNPKQIRGALSQPHRIWSAKSHHMAARDVEVDQDGSVILATNAGTVWRRTKRATIKNAIAPSTSNRPKDYKFLRVPGLTRVVAVRASAFGAYAVVRKDCDVTKTQIGVDEPNLWRDVAPLISLDELFNHVETSDDEDPSPRFWQRPSSAQSLRKRTLQSTDLEIEVTDIIRQKLFASGDTYNMELGTTLSDVRIPVHEFILGRSAVFRNAMNDFRSCGDILEIPDLMTISQSGDRVTIVFHGVDFLTIFNLAVYVYTDSVVDFWNVTRQFPKMAFRYRSVRTELMKIASRLELRQLEPAVRQMINPRKSLNLEMELAIKDPSFFESGDVIVDLADGEMLLHSAILCQRCPFFDGLFRGRAGGQWLAGRQTEGSSHIRVDLTHVETWLFDLVVRHIYADAGEEIFDGFTSEDLNDFLALDELLDHIMDIMSIANELMLDRLSQICQMLIGRYVNARNVCSLLNAIAPSSVAEFKDAALEYICLSLEAVMQHSSLDELADDVLLELNQVVRDNQLANLPFARSGRAEALLYDKYPELTERIERGKRAKIDSIMLSNKYSDRDGAVSTSFHAQSLEELSTSPIQQRTRRRASRDAKSMESPSTTPLLKGKASVPDLMFEMSDGEDEETTSTKRIARLEFVEKQSLQTPIGSPEASWSNDQIQSYAPQIDCGKEGVSLPLPSPIASREVRTPGRPWAATPLEGSKLDLRDIMSQTASDRPSNLTLGLTQQAKAERPVTSFHSKISQKERKRQQQAQQLAQPTTIEKPQPAPPAMSPWQATSQRKASGASLAIESAQTPQSPSTPQLTMRQTVAKHGKDSTPKGVKPSSQPLRGASNKVGAAQNRPSPASGPGMSVSTTPIAAPHSVRHIPLPSHSPTSPSQHFSMNEILSMQEAEKTYIKDAAAKRSLQEIQQEQEFQEWWDQESKRVMVEEEQRKRNEDRAAKAARGRGRGRGGKGKSKTKEHRDEEDVPDRGKVHRNIIDATGTKQDAIPTKSTPKSTPRSSNNERGRGRGKSRGGHGGGRGSRAQCSVQENVTGQGEASHEQKTAT
ncbi:hypothetical protein B0J11DRAFT_479304 [Dendryphion nanum]|uniref:BTB domain-containing protein n=1 Tax=Dendryphion nanum TaxID=256645 RepID=A0A9P9IYV9_9PLEO|nr:hypothetical protein B0J11DRAFT_479304 [Dendryphion nanum]